MKIYLTDLAAYNNGHLVGEWLTLPLEEEELKEAIDGILSRGLELCGYGNAHEEYFITDWECELFDIGEHESPYSLNEKALKVEDLNGEEMRKVRFLLEGNYVANLDEAIEKVNDVTIHKKMSMRGVAEAYLSENNMLEDVSDMVRNNIDYEGVANDLSISGSYEEINSDVFEYRGV